MSWESEECLSRYPASFAVTETQFLKIVFNNIKVNLVFNFTFMNILEQKFEVLTTSWVQNSSILELLGSEKTLLFFYPKDNTPGCSLENKDFTCLKWAYEKIWVKLIGVSKDSIASHEKFQANYGLENDLVSDPTLELHKAYNAYGEKNNYGKIVQGVIRSTVLLDNKGNTLKIWNNVKATWHAEKILKELSK